MDYTKFIKINVDENDRNTKLNAHMYENNEYFHAYENRMVNTIGRLCKSIDFDFKSIVEITSFSVAEELRHQNIGKSFFDQLIETTKALEDKVIIVCKVDCNLDRIDSCEDIDEIKKKEVKRVALMHIADMCSYLEVLGFRSIQSVCSFKNSIPYILPTPRIKELMEEIIKNEIILPKNTLGGNMYEDIDNIDQIRDKLEASLKEINDTINNLSKVIAIGSDIDTEEFYDYGYN